ncbi:hypothetical protein AVEN_139596-1 [Araneus ventricosus]|uniref:Uncharacterized protein n=1 Tax=Araneus ventricosus TaxID=182803 RepID=A0A4Y2BNB2_ARAVE|nr:hypothetical protein AVEN_139596-1 [Araneus ventricosus]
MRRIIKERKRCDATVWCNHRQLLLPSVACRENADDPAATTINRALHPHYRPYLRAVHCDDPSNREYDPPSVEVSDPTQITISNSQTLF